MSYSIEMIFFGIFLLLNLAYGIAGYLALKNEINGDQESFAHDFIRSGYGITQSFGQLVIIVMFLLLVSIVFTLVAKSFSVEVDLMSFIKGLFLYSIPLGFLFLAPLFGEFIGRHIFNKVNFEQKS